VQSPSLDALRTPANGQIFGLKTALSNAAVEEAFAAASREASGRRLGKTIRQKGTLNGGAYRASFICFPLTRRPAFLPGTDLAENTYGFLLLIEVEVNGEWYVGVFQHDAATVADWIDARAKRLPRGKFTNAFSENSTVRRMSLQRMTASKHELRAASYEASDLLSSLPMMAAGRCVIRSIRFQNHLMGSIAVTISTSRVQQSGGRRTVDDLAELVAVVVQQTQANKRHVFLTKFAQSVALADLPAGVEPTSVLFDWGAILENDALELYRKPNPQEELGHQIAKEVLSRFLEGTMPVTPEGTGNWRFGTRPQSPRGRLALTSTRYSVKSILSNLLVVRDVDSDETMTLVRWVRENDAYSVTFTQPEYFFGSGALYQRANFASEVDSVRQCLRPEPLLAVATSEKGEPKPTDVSFADESIFGLVDGSIYAQRDWLVCNDLGDEWADFICVRDNTLLFLHCKHGKPTTGASSFQDVIGQALKNLGRIQSTPSLFKDKLAAIEANNPQWAGTQIRRLRGAGTWPAFQAAVGALLVNPDVSKEVHLVVSMISKAAFEAAAAAPTPHFIQQVWLLSSFVNSCREMGGKPVIVCLP